MNAIDPEAQELLELWFGALDADGCADAAHMMRWWKKDPEFDAMLRDRFLGLHRAVQAGDHAGWLATPRGRLAAVIVLDQLSRNMFRDQAEAFGSDLQAQRIALEGIGLGADRRLATEERMFLYMPLVHAEDLEVQDRAVELFAALAAAAPPGARERGRRTLEFAIKHRDLVARYGRFPHRNAVLGRTSTEPEIELLKQPGSGF